MMHELSIGREVDVPPEALFRGWTDPEWMEQWFCPRPWTTRATQLDPRPGGTFAMEMVGPDGTVNPVHGVYLEVVKDRRIVFTDAYRAGWVPNEKPFMTAVVDLAPLAAGGTRYTAAARHWSAEDRDRHAAMGFDTGWNAALDQLIALARSR